MHDHRGWVQAPGDSLLERLAWRRDPVRVAVQWLALGIVVAAAVSSSTWMIGAGVAVFILMGLGLRSKRLAETAVFDELTRLSADSRVDAAVRPTSGVTIFSPARDEENEIETALRSICTLDYPHFDVIAINDHSIDATPAIMNRLDRQFSRLRVVHDPEPQEGWTGKANGIWKAVPLANPEHEWFLFTDADVIFHPDALTHAVAYAESKRLDFLTCLPYLTTGSIWEAATLPPIWRSMICGVPDDRLNDADSYPVGIGAFLLIRRAIYEASGGHSVYPDQHMEDIVLAGLVKEQGGKVGLAWTPDLLRIRLYSGLRHLNAAIMNKLRVLGNDRLSRPLSEASQRALPLLLPLPLSVVAVWRQVWPFEMNWWLSIYAVAGILVYFENVRIYRDARETSDVGWWIPWIHPLGGMVRFGIAIRTVIAILLDTDSHWRGRKTFIRKRN
jgi:glycosyltransferase involved in cell wall biosynthesis